MSGVTTLLLGEGGGSGGGGGGGTLGSLSWNSIHTADLVTVGSTNTLTISGITGSLTLAGAAAPGPPYPQVGAILNGSYPAVFATGGAPYDVTVVNGDTVAWVLSNPRTSGVSGTVTVTRTDTSATVDTFSYYVSGSSSP